MKCDQCNNQAAIQYPNAGLSLCLSCSERLQRMVIATNQMLREQQDYLMDQIEMTMGVSLRPPKLVQPIVQGPTTHNYISIANSVVGAVNTGTIASLNVSLQQIRNGGNSALSETVKKFAEAVLSERTISDEVKNEIADQLACILEEIRKPKEQKRTGILKAAARSIATTVATIKGLADLWELVHPYLPL